MTEGMSACLKHLERAHKALIPGGAARRGPCCHLSAFEAHRLASAFQSLVHQGAEPRHHGGSRPRRRRLETMALLGGSHLKRWVHSFG